MSGATVGAAVLAGLVFGMLVLGGGFLHLWLTNRRRELVAASSVESLVAGKVRSRLIVTLKSGAGFDGVLYAADAETWVLRGASALGAGDRDENVPVDGEIVIFTADIDYAQKP